PLPMSELLALLGTTQDGLTQAEVRIRLKKIGMNRISVHSGPSIFKIFIRQFFNPLVLILLAAAILKFSLADILNGSVLAGTIGIMAFIGFFQEVRAVRAMKALQKLSAHCTKVKRSGHNQLVLSETLVPGDLIILEAGDKVPADARLLEVSNFKVNESTLTGESNPVEKHTAILQGNPLLGERKNMVYIGTIIACGKALAIVVSTGLYTELGKIAATMQGEKEKKTPLQSNIDFIGIWMLCIVFIAVILFVCVGLYRGMDWLEVFLLAVAAAVCAIPEGLPAAFTICLASGVNAMSKKHAIIRKLIAVETLGSTTIICSDKTGTLTLNQLTVKYLYTLEGLICSEDLKSKTCAGIQEILNLGVLCNDALLTKEGDGTEILGDPTEGALLKVAADFGVQREVLEGHYPRIDTIPFASENLYMATLHAKEGLHKVIVKGAPEKLLSLSSWGLKGDQIIPLGELEKEKILSSVNEMADKTYRVIAVCFCENPSLEGFLDESLFKGKLIFAGFFAMIDPLREEATEAILLCQRAGVQVVMMTGDSVRTAQAIAEQIKMNASSVLCGETIKDLNDEELKESIRNIQVFARVEPMHKLRIVKAFQALGHVVAVTGDGVNDAPALEAADIGIAMGKLGTDVA
ncbi:MAG: HAD-IC family P-type ATPase, partial [Chlamydiota bacterium]